MAAPGEPTPLLPPPLAAWVGGIVLRGVWAAGGLGLLVAAVALDGVAGAAGATGGDTPAPAVAADPVAVLPAPNLENPPPPPRPAGMARTGTTSAPPPSAAATAPRRHPAPQVRAPLHRVKRPGTGAGAAPQSEPPAPGSYTYAVTRDGQASTAVLTVLGQGVESGDVLQEQSWSTPDGTTRSGTSWSPEAELLEWSDSDGSSSCTYDHPVQWLRLPLSPGAQWQGQSSCSYSDNSGMLVRTVQSSAARVVTAASTDLGGDRIFCWVVERDVVTTSVAGDTRATSETRTTDLFAPSLGLTVYETGKSAVPQADGSVATDTWTARLDS